MNQVTNQKECIVCKKFKNISNYHKDSKNKDKLKNSCKSCCAIRDRVNKRKKGGYGMDRSFLTEAQIEYRKCVSISKRKYYLENSEKNLVNHAKRRAREKNMEFSLSEDDIKIPKLCPVLNIPLEIGEKFPTSNSPSIDRFDSTRGYTKDNINIISNRANTIKSDATFEEFEAIYKWWKSEIKKKKKCQNTT